MRADLPQSQKRLECAQDASAGLELLHHLLLRGREHRPVRSLLFFGKRAIKDGLGPWRKLGSHFALHASQDQGLDPAPQAVDLAQIEAALEFSATSEQPGLHE